MGEGVRKKVEIHTTAYTCCLLTTDSLPTHYGYSDLDPALTQTLTTYLLTSTAHSPLTYSLTHLLTTYYTPARWSAFPRESSWLGSGYGQWSGSGIGVQLGVRLAGPSRDSTHVHVHVHTCRNHLYTYAYVHTHMNMHMLYVWMGVPARPRSHRG